MSFNIYFKAKNALLEYSKIIVQRWSPMNNKRSVSFEIRSLLNIVMYSCTPSYAHPIGNNSRLRTNIIITYEGLAPHVFITCPNH